MANHSAADGRISVNIGTAVPNADGTVTIVVSHGPSTHPNAVSTMDYPRGNLAFRWFLPDAVPAPPEVTLVKLAEAPVAISRVNRRLERWLYPTPPMIWSYLARSDHFPGRGNGGSPTRGCR